MSDKKDRVCEKRTQCDGQEMEKRVCAHAAAAAATQPLCDCSHSAGQREKEVHNAVKQPVAGGCGCDGWKGGGLKLIFASCGLREWCVEGVGENTEKIRGERDEKRRREGEGVQTRELTGSPCPCSRRSCSVRGEAPSGERGGGAPFWKGCRASYQRWKHWLHRRNAC